MEKEQIAAIVIGLIFLMSMAGFALTSMTRLPRRQQHNITIPTIVNRQLTQEEKIYVLQTGKVLIEDFYVSGCASCETDRKTLEAFVQRFEQFIILEEVEIPANATNETTYVKLQMIGKQGLIKDLRDIQITQDNLTDIFCDIALVQPRECLLKEI